MKGCINMANTIEIFNLTFEELDTPDISDDNIMAFGVSGFETYDHASELRNYVNEFLSMLTTIYGNHMYSILSFHDDDILYVNKIEYPEKCMNLFSKFHEYNKKLTDNNLFNKLRSEFNEDKLSYRLTSENCEEAYSSFDFYDIFDDDVIYLIHDGKIEINSGEDREKEEEIVYNKFKYYAFLPTDTDIKVIFHIFKSDNKRFKDAFVGSALNSACTKIYHKGMKYSENSRLLYADSYYNKKNDVTLVTYIFSTSISESMNHRDYLPVLASIQDPEGTSFVTGIKIKSNSIFKKGGIEYSSKSTYNVTERILSLDISTTSEVDNSIIKKIAENYCCSHPDAWMFYDTYDKSMYFRHPPFLTVPISSEIKEITSDPDSDEFHFIIDVVYKNISTLMIDSFTTHHIYDNDVRIITNGLISQKQKDELSESLLSLYEDPVGINPPIFKITYDMKILTESNLLMIRQLKAKDPITLYLSLIPNHSLDPVDKDPNVVMIDLYEQGVLMMSRKDWEKFLTIKI